MNNVYFVKFRLHGIYEEEMGIPVLARNKVDAYHKAVYEEIPRQFDTHPYSAWVSSVTYQNGNCRYFNTSEGNPY